MAKTTPSGQPNPEAMGLPPRVFMYTLDQVAFMLGVDQKQFAISYVHYEGRSTGFHTKDRFLARNVAPRHETPQWRISEKEFMRWLRFKGFKIYERGAVVE